MAKYISHGGKTIIDSEEMLEEILQKTAKGFCTGIAQSAAKRLKSNTAELVYNDYTPTKYSRTMEFLNSIVGPGFNGGDPTRKTGTGFISEVKFDTDKMNLYEPQKDAWGIHVGFYGEDAREAVIEGFEENGFAVFNRKGNLVYQRDPVGMIATTEEEIMEVLNSVDGEFMADPESSLQNIIVRVDK